MTILRTYQPIDVGDQVFRGYTGSWVKTTDLTDEIAKLWLLVNGEENPKETLQNRLTILQLNLNRTGS